jgi:hypothetical protein
MSERPLPVIPVVVGLTLKEEAAFFWTEGFKVFRDAMPVVEVPAAAQLHFAFLGKRIEEPWRVFVSLRDTRRAGHQLGGTLVYSCVESHLRSSRIGTVLLSKSVAASV